MYKSLIAVIAAHQIGLSKGPPDSQDTIQFCLYMAATNVLLECVIIRNVSQEGRSKIVDYANYTLHHLMGGLQAANYEDLATSDHSWFVHIVSELAALVNVVTQEPAFPIRALVPEDRISTLEYAIISLRDAMRRFGRPEEDYMVRDRADKDETLEDKLVRLRELRSRYYGPTPHGDNPQPGTNVSP